jgi:hypothetical protein
MNTDLLASSRIGVLTPLPRRTNHASLLATAGTNDIAERAYAARAQTAVHVGKMAEIVTHGITKVFTRASVESCAATAYAVPGRTVGLNGHLPPAA